MHTHLSHIKFCISNINCLTICIKLPLKAKIRLGEKAFIFKIVSFKFLLHSTFLPFLFSIHMIYFSETREDDEDNSVLVKLSTFIWTLILVLRWAHCPSEIFYIQMKKERLS